MTPEETVKLGLSPPWSARVGSAVARQATPQVAVAASAVAASADDAGPSGAKAADTEPADLTSAVSAEAESAKSPDAADAESPGAESADAESANAESADAESANAESADAKSANAESANAESANAWATDTWSAVIKLYAELADTESDVDEPAETALAAKSADEAPAGTWSVVVGSAVPGRTPPGWHPVPSSKPADGLEESVDWEDSTPYNPPSVSHINLIFVFNNCLNNCLIILFLATNGLLTSSLIFINVLSNS